MKKIRFDNYAIKMEKRGKTQWYKWKVFVDEDDMILDTIESVTYVLHPTFPNPVRVVIDRGSRFSLESIGWGSFDTMIRIKFKDGKEQEERYYLDLQKSKPVHP